MTTCVKACLDYLEISTKGCTNLGGRDVWAEILAGKGFTIEEIPHKGSVQKLVNHINSEETVHVVLTRGHILLVNGKGRVLVDTCPIDGSDYRYVVQVFKIFYRGRLIQ